MWQQNPDSLEWKKIEDTITKSSFDFLKQEMESTRLYQVCLGGSSFLNIKNLENIYDILQYTQSFSWIISTSSSTYSSYYSFTYSKDINPTTLEEYNKYLKDYALTIKTKFSPNRLLNDSLMNFKQVDVVTNTGLTAFGLTQNELRINGTLLKKGHTVLVKDQTRLVNLSNEINPKDYFTSSYGVQSIGLASTTYSIWTDENGVYKYDGSKLTRTDHLETYDKLYNLSLDVKLTNSTETQYHLERLSNGYFPEYQKGESVRFTEKKNYLLRNRVDYNNIYEIVYNDIAKWSGHTFSFNNETYSVPTRTISIGEFGAIYLNQSGYSTILPNKYKATLNEIKDTDSFYWICGTRGHLLRVNKVDFEMQKIELNEIHELTSIDFVDNLNGIVVGKFNTIFMTYDGGKTWQKIVKEEFDSYSYTKVLYLSRDKIFIGGEAGLFIEVQKNSNDWIFYKRMIVKDLDTTEPTENYLMVDDVNDLTYATYSLTTWPLKYSFLTQSSIKDDKEVLFIATNGNNLIVKDLNSFDSLFEYKYLGFTNSNIDINSIIPISGSSSFYIGADKIYKLNLQTFNSLNETSNLISSFATASIIHDVYANELFGFNSQQLMICGNNSLLQYTGFTESVFDIDSSFENQFKSKMLFMEYDIASKLNFFDDEQQYRLPNSVSMTFSQIGNWFCVNNIEGQNNWLTYYKDFEKTFKYYTSFDTSNQVVFSSNFTFSANSYYTMSSSAITGATADILPLAPNILDINSPLIIGSSSVISGPATPKDIYFSRHLIIFRRTTAYLVDLGDVMYLGCDILRAKFVVNRIETISGYKYIYCFHDFEQGVINDLLNYTDIVNIVNLNKYASIEEVDSKEIAYDNEPFLYPWNYDNDINPEDYFAYAPFKNPELYGNLLFNFNIHPVAYGYKLTLIDGVYTLEPRFNNKTAYYNMESKVETEFLLDYMQYTDKFLNFGFKPTYNLLDYLSNINPYSFTASKVFYAMPVYNSLPGLTGMSFTSSNIYFDTDPLSIWPKNKIVFGSGLYFEWNSIWKNTFVDITLNSTTTSRMFVMDKYWDEILQGYVIEFHKKINFVNYEIISTINISSRRTLAQISEDLQLLNNIHRSTTTKMFNVPGYESDSFINLINETNFKFNTDNYTKIFLSDKSIKDNITAIIFTDDKNELSLNILNLDKQINKNITNTSSYNISGTNYLKLTTLEKHGLNNKDSINVYFTGSTSSSAFLNRSYFGFQFVKQVIDEYNFVTDKLFKNTISGTDSGYLVYVSRDPYFNFQPVDLMQIGSDNVQKKAHLVEPINVNLSGYTYSLIDIDLNKYRYQLVDGLSITEFYQRYSWALEGVINEAIIGQDENGLIWYKGLWECGRWFGGSWLSGTWLSGDWYSGFWTSIKISGNAINPLIVTDENKEPIASNNYSKWFGGRWFDGTWRGGTWYNGRVYNIDWFRGIWNDGIWNDGTWRNGQFRGGVWITGKWESGTFNSSNRPSYWLDGIWRSGDFENGIWYNGVFNSDNGLSRFGTKAFNSRTAIWHGGKLRNAEFHSYLNTDNEGNTIDSEYNKYSQWNTGLFQGGEWYGGLALSINFKNANWYGGVIEDIQITGFEVFTQSDNNNWGTKITLNGIYYFNILDEIWIINEFETMYDYFGSKDFPKKYYVMSVDQIDDKTIILLDRDLKKEVEIVQDSVGVDITGATSVSNIDTGLRVTAHFAESNWKRGVWTNGIFESGFFEGGIWYGGRFSANWGR
jgi:hypothetical protein